MNFNLEEWRMWQSYMFYAGGKNNILNVKSPEQNLDALREFIEGVVVHN